jgi:oxalate decarboxylase/phosphoglucose isomerase-like protein (cupin superfamily)
MRFAALTTLVLGAVFRVAAQTADLSKVAAIIAQLEDTPATSAQFNLFSGREYVFDFNQGIGVTGGAGGNLTIANVVDFPYLFGKGMALSVGRMAPCGLATPHYHPRAAEFLYMLSGEAIQTGFILENGARFVEQILNTNQGFLYPGTAFHYQANLGCTPATFVAGFNHEDPGVATVGQNFFGLPPNVTDVILGDIGIDEATRIARLIPDTFAIGIQSCLTRCNIQRTAQPTTQQVPRVIGNGFPAPNTTRRDESSLNKRQISEEPVVSPTPVSSALFAANLQSLGELVFLLKIVVCVMLSGYVFTWAYFVLPTWRNRKLQAELQAHAVSAPPQDIKV